MKKFLYSLLVLVFAQNVSAQVFEWRLRLSAVDNTDPDGVGPAVRSVRFTLQIHTTGATVPNITQIATGYSYQSSRALIPPLTGCGLITSTPANITMSPAFAAAGFFYTSVAQCNTLLPTINTGGQIFDRRANGTIDNGSITIGPAWVDVFTVTLWALSLATPEAGFVIINSSEGGAPGEYTTYSVTDGSITQYPANSLTYATPLELSSTAVILPVLFTKFDAQCLPNKSVSVSWATSQETNSSYFEILKSTNGVDWLSVSKVTAAGNSPTEKIYQVNDPQGGTAQYRLKQVDKDGRISYSTIFKSSCESRNTYVTLYPVPARDVVTVVVGADKAVKTNLQVYDTKGQMVINMPVTITSGVNNFKIPVHNLTNGEYILRGTNESLQINKRFTIIR